jgi:Nif-specific regulatory protein
MKSYPWHGNVRELSSVIQQMILFCNGHALTANDLPPHFRFESGNVQEGTGGKVHLPKMVSDLEGKWILKMLKECDWNQEKASKLLGITRKMLTNRIKKYGLKNLEKKIA